MTRIPSWLVVAILLFLIIACVHGVMVHVGQSTGFGPMR